MKARPHRFKRCEEANGFAAEPKGTVPEQNIAAQGPDSLLKKAVGSDWKGKLSPLIYGIAIPTAFWSPWISQGLYVLVALVWLVPDRRIENALAGKAT